MITEDFKEGFIKTCMSCGCNSEQTETLYKIAAKAQAFESKEFRKGFEKQVRPDFNVDSLSIFAKSELVDRAQKGQY